jgi:hypothetical protein
MRNRQTVFSAYPDEDTASMTSNIVISRSFSAYFWRFPLISAAKAEEESTFFGAFVRLKIGALQREESNFPAVAAAGTAAATELGNLIRRS